MLKVCEDQPCKHLRFQEESEARVAGPFRSSGFVTQALASLRRHLCESRSVLDEESIHELLVHTIWYILSIVEQDALNRALAPPRPRGTLGFLSAEECVHSLLLRPQPFSMMLPVLLPEGRLCPDVVWTLCAVMPLLLAHAATVAPPGHLLHMSKRSRVWRRRCPCLAARPRMH
jgi:hypothetical protein